MKHVRFKILHPKKLQKTAKKTAILRPWRQRSGGKVCCSTFLFAACVSGRFCSLHVDSGGFPVMILFVIWLLCRLRCASLLFETPRDLGCKLSGNFVFIEGNTFFFCFLCYPPPHPPGPLALFIFVWLFVCLFVWFFRVILINYKLMRSWERIDAATLDSGGLPLTNQRGSLA